MIHSDIMNNFRLYPTLKVCMKESGTRKYVELMVILSLRMKFVFTRFFVFLFKEIIM